MLKAKADQIPLPIAAGASRVTVSDFAIISVDSKIDSGSSIDVLANDDLELDRVSITTGQGHDGKPGLAQSQVAPGADGTAGAGERWRGRRLSSDRGVQADADEDDHRSSRRR
ncbi:MAG TPA: hypothetical protein VHB21_12425 [Minicystis sp.]|nr:hypothetical protein [Minicystis sp.]